MACCRHLGRNILVEDVLKAGLHVLVHFVDICCMGVPIDILFGPDASTVLKCIQVSSLPQLDLSTNWLSTSSLSMCFKKDHIMITQPWRTLTFIH